VTIQRLSISGPEAVDFSTRDDHCTGTLLGPARNCTVGVAFTPHAVGSKNADLSIFSSDLEFSPITVSLAGSSPAHVTETNSNYCLITWMVEGSMLEGLLDIFRNFRDLFLAENIFGRALIEVYYRESPRLILFFSRNEFLKEISCLALIPLAVSSYLVLHAHSEVWIFLVLFIACHPQAFRKISTSKDRPCSP
jgi:hypothetical protein